MYKNSEKSVAPKNVKNNENLCIFRKMSTPQIATTGAKSGVATHQLAPSKPSSCTATAAIATGLKMCLFFIAKIYFDAMAMSDATTSMTNPSPLDAGEKIKKRIMPEINEDSKLMYTEKICAKSTFTKKHSERISVSESPIESKLNGSNPSSDRIVAKIVIAERLNIMILYIVKELMSSSIGLKIMLRPMLTMRAIGLYKNTMVIERSVSSFMIGFGYIGAQ